MQTITTAAELKDAIKQLEEKQAAEWLLLKEEFHDTYEKFKPINIIKSTFREAVTGPDLKTNALNAAIGLTTGMVAKKVLVGKTLNPLKKLLGMIVEVAVARKVAQNTNSIRSVGSMIMKKIFNKRNDTEKV